MNNNNTVVFVEPRIFEHAPIILNHFVDILGLNWNYIFYCGKNTKSYWEHTFLHKIYQIRELDVDNFPEPKYYSDFMKQKHLWESLYGEFVLTAQLDTWITKNNGYNIYDFIRLDKSYIGGNMCYEWPELFPRDNFKFEYRNFNGGLSLRKRNDMIKVIDAFPPQTTSSANNVFNRNLYTDAEDVYFTLGCCKLGLPIGNDEISSHFAIHSIFKDKFFGIHQPLNEVKTCISNCYPDLNYINPYLKL
jgi:hypothetical protein